MKKTLKRSFAVLLAAILSLTVVGTGATAAELNAEENAVVEQGVESVNGYDTVAEVGAALDDDAAPAEVGASAPEISSIELCNEGVKVSWKALSGVNYYRVERWFSDGRGWVKLKDTSELNYVDANVSSGNAYQYRLSGISAGGSVITPTATQSYTYYAPASISSTETLTTGIELSWELPSGVNKVALYRKNSGSWQRIATVTGSSYIDKNVTYGNEYQYTIRALKDDGSFMDDVYDNNGVTAKYLKMPELSVSNAAGGVNISWNAVDGAEGYRVFYRNGSGGWSRLGSTTATSLLDDDVASGYTYTYTVRCISADGENYTSYFDTAGKSVYYIAAPVLVSAAATNDGINITWKKCNGAAKYRVFYRNSRGNWAKLGDTASTSFLDEDVSSGSTYVYTVRCMDSAGNYISSYYSDGIKGTYLSPPEFSVSCGADGVDIKWDAVKGAVNYRVYYYGSKGWTRLADTTQTSFVDTDVSSGYNYTYTVRCINADGTDFTSGHRSGKSVKYYAAPAITGMTSTEDGIRISWDAVRGAEKYRVYYYGSNGWTKMTDTTATSYLDEDVSSGHTYTYTVRCINSAGTAFLSYFKPGVNHLYINAPDFRLTRNEKSVTVSWDKVEGAELYRVYAGTANGWSKIADTKDTSYEDKNVISGSTYTYTVRCMNAAATEFTSDYRAGKTVTFVEMPRIKSVYNTPEGVGITWGAVSGAAKYRLYYWGSNGWTKLVDTTDTSFVDTDVDSGHTYTYTIRCINAEGTEFESTYDPDGKSVDYIAAPKDLKAESYNNGIKISWTHSDGAAKYRVYYYGSNGWTKLTETTSNSFVDDDVASGYTYRYTVRCLSEDGRNFTSDYDHEGVSCKFTTMPVLKSAEVTTDGGIRITWGAVTGAEKYRVYYYGSKGWTKMVETDDTYALDYDVASGHTYRYTVRCITEDGNAFTSDCDTKGISAYYCSIPKLDDIDISREELTFSWKKPNGASKFRVYKRVDGSWHRLTDTTSNYYTDTNVSFGNTYTYTVRVINSDGTEFYSGFDPDGFIITMSTSESFVYYDQNQYSYPYGDDTIAGSGCGPTCFAMIASTYTGKSITPIDAVKWCGNSYYVYNVGTMWSYFGDACKRFNVPYGGSTYDIDVAYNALKNGKYVISAQSRGLFTSGGHFITLAGISANGRIIVYDPNGGNNYIGATFTKAQVDEAASCYWIFG